MPTRGSRKQGMRNKASATRSAVQRKATTSGAHGKSRSKNERVEAENDDE